MHMVLDQIQHEVHSAAPVERVWRLLTEPEHVRPREGNSTLVEFTLTPQDGGTRVRVVERGFRALDMSPDEQAAHARDNLPGWTGGFAGLVEHAQRAVA
jgi:uncharacterized protein YndB with AHSA1/START domain